MSTLPWKELKVKSSKFRTTCDFSILFSIRLALPLHALPSRDLISHECLVTTRDGTPLEEHEKERLHTRQSPIPGYINNEIGEGNHFDKEREKEIGRGKENMGQQNMQGKKKELFNVPTMVVMTGRESGESLPDERDREPKEESERREATIVACDEKQTAIEDNQNNRSN